MAQHDYVIDNSTGANVRADINNVLQAIATNNSGSSAPSATFASQFFADTNAGIMKLRNTSDNGYVNLFTLAGGIDVDAASNFAATVTFTDDVTFDGATAGKDIVFDRSDNALEFADDTQIRIGTGNDLTIFHESSSNFNVLRQNNALSTKWLAGGDTVARFMTNGAVELYYDNSKKFETASHGATFFGTSFHGDNIVSAFGASSDLQLYHNGTNSYIDNHQGDLYIRGDSDHIVLQAVDNESSIVCDPNGAVNLYYDNSKKLETTSTGVSLTGNLNIPDDNEVMLGTNSDIRMFHANGNANFIQSYNDVDFRIHTFGTTASLRLQVNESENAVVCVPNGATELYHNGTKKFETHSAGVKVSAGNLYLDRDSAKAVFGASDDLELYHNGTDTFVDNATGNLAIRTTGATHISLKTNNENAIYCGANGAVQLYYDNAKKFETASAGVDVTGRVQIDGHCFPYSDNAYDLGLSGNRWRNLYTTDLQLSNEGKSNDVDGTWGDYTIQEGESDLFLINNRSGKKYKFNLTEVS